MCWRKWKGFPLSLLVNADLMGADLPVRERLDHQKRLLSLLRELKQDLKAGRDIFANPKLVDGLLSVSKCPDFIINKGHYFGSNLGDDDKNALIEFLKTL